MPVFYSIHDEVIINNDLEIRNNTSFESIKHIDENGKEFWYARELQKVLEYKEWRNFDKVIEKAKMACKQSLVDTTLHFVGVNKPIIGGNGNIQNVSDYELTRYACYLIDQNGDSRKKVIAVAQTYSAFQTRKQELSEKVYMLLTEDLPKRIN